MFNLNFILVKAVQFISLSFFTFIVFIYIGGAVIMPLALLVGVVKLLGNGIFATIIAIPLVAWLLRRAYRIPGLWSALYETGQWLIRTGAENFRKFDDISRTVKGIPSGPANTASPVSRS